MFSRRYRGVLVGLPDAFDQLRRAFCLRRTEVEDPRDRPSVAQPDLAAPGRQLPKVVGRDCGVRARWQSREGAPTSHRKT
jgi:hypothetical protein